MGTKTADTPEHIPPSVDFATNAINAAQNRGSSGPNTSRNRWEVSFVDMEEACKEENRVIENWSNDATLSGV